MGVVVGDNNTHRSGAQQEQADLDNENRNADVEIDGVLGNGGTPQIGAQSAQRSLDDDDSDSDLPATLLKSIGAIDSRLPNYTIPFEHTSVHPVHHPLPRHEILLLMAMH